MGSTGLFLKTCRQKLCRTSGFYVINLLTFDGNPSSTFDNKHKTFEAKNIQKH